MHSLNRCRRMRLNSNTPYLFLNVINHCATLQQFNFYLLVYPIMINTRLSTLTPIKHPLLQHHSILAWMKRDDLIHPWLSGNKGRKLRDTLKLAKTQHRTTLISFGGCFSNHLYALAGAGQLFGFQTVGIIRGEADPDNPTLKWLIKQGMVCHFVTRQTYQQRHDQAYQAMWQARYPNSMVIPEGGYAPAAMAGVGDIIEELSTHDYDMLCCAVGSGTTLAGLAYANRGQRQLWGFCALKNAHYLEDNINHLQRAYGKQAYPFSLSHDDHHGGFAKAPPALIDLTADFSKQTGIPIEPIYTGKMVAGVFNKIQQGQIVSGSKLVLLHTGGLQGSQGLAYLSAKRALKRQQQR